MDTDTTSTELLVEVLSTRLRRIDVVGWRRIATWAEESDLSFEHLRLLLVLAVKTDDGPTSVSELGDLAGLAPEAAYPATHALHGRGYLREERRRYALTEQGLDLVAGLNAAHREGVQAYVETLDRDERERLVKAFLQS